MPIWFTYISYPSGDTKNQTGYLTTNGLRAALASFGY